MEKRGEVNKSYKKRWFVFYSNGMMDYMVDPADSKLRGSVSFAAIKAIDRTTPITFEVTTDKKVWSFRCSTETLCNEWIDAMQLIQSPPTTTSVTVDSNAPNDDPNTDQCDKSPTDDHVFKGLAFSIYKNPNSDCSDASNDIPITDRCPALKRLCTASLHFDAVNSYKIEDALKKSLWVEFNEEVYPNVVEDTIHLVRKHGNDIQQIQREWMERYGFPKCTISECTKTVRHYGRERRERANESNNGEEDAMYEFHQSLHDRVHNFVFHLFDIGMRVHTPSIGQGADDEEEKDANLEGVAVDKWFAMERDHIKKRKQELNMTSERMDPLNNKYTIQMILGNKGKVTLMDALFLKLSEKMKNQKEALRRIRDYFEDNSFDSECIEMDIEDVADSNISTFVETEAVVQTMCDFIRPISCMYNLSSFRGSHTVKGILSK